MKKNIQNRWLKTYVIFCKYISPTIARLFTEFKTFEVVVDLWQNFRKFPCTCMFCSAHTFFYLFCECECTDLLQVHYYLLKLSLKFRKDPSIGRGDICKILLFFFLIFNFQCNFHISPIMHLQSIQRWIITEWL